MTEAEMREMVKDIIDNGAEYEVKTPGDVCLNALIGGEYLPDEFNNPVVEVELEWKPYKLGEEIHLDWEYRKVEKWYVVENPSGGFSIKRDSKFETDPCREFEGSKEACEKWVEENTKKTWLEEKVNDMNYGWNKDKLNTYICGYKKGTEEVCKKILEEVQKNGDKKNHTMGKHYFLI